MKMDIKRINTIRELKEAGYQPKSIKEELRANLIKRLQNKQETFSGIIGYEDTVIPDVERALLSKHNILFLGLRGQAKTRMARQMTDLQARIQVALFNILEEGDVQIRGFKLRLPLDILFVFTANPEDYTNRGSIVTPLKDRIESQILTHYPKSLEHALSITEQEADIAEEQKSRVAVSDLVKRLIEQVAFEARGSEFVDKKSGVSARLTISAFENAVSAAERRAIINNEKNTHVWISDLIGIIPSITGKIELVYEGEQEGPYQVAMNLLDKSIRSQFILYFPNPEQLKKRAARKGETPQVVDNPYRSIINWFDKGNHINLFFAT